MITEAGIKAAIRDASTSAKARLELKDSGARGEGRLAMVVTARDTRVASEWYAVWYAGEQRKMVKIGSYPTMGLGMARKMFREDYAPKISQGMNPTGPRAKRERAGVTVKDLFEAYIANLRASERPSAGYAERVLLKSGGGGAAGSLGGSRRAADITSRDIIPLLSEIHARGAVTSAALTRAYLSAAFAFGLKTANAYTGERGASWNLTSNPVTAIPVDPNAFRAGDRFLSPGEFRDFWNWLASRAAPEASALRLCMATGQRIIEIRKLTVGMYDQVEMMLDWGKTKNGRPHNIPLPPQAVAILGAVTPSQYGFYFPPPRNPARAMSGDRIGNLVLAYLDAHPDHEHFTARDIRRTWKTLAGAAGLPKEIRDRLQNHAKSDVSARHYDRWDALPERRAAMAVWGDYLAGILRAPDQSSPATGPLPLAPDQVGALSAIN